MRPARFYDDLAENYDLIYADWEGSMRRHGALITALLQSGPDPLRRGMVAVVLALGCADAAGPADYDAGAVIGGSVRRANGEAVSGASVQVEVYRAGCGDGAIRASGGGVFTDATGAFEGDYSFLSVGPLVADCLRVQVVETLRSTLLGDTLVVGDVRFDAMRSDTVRLDIEI